MSNLKTRRVIIFTTILSLFIAIVLPSVAFADNDRGRGQGNRGRGQERRYERREDNWDRRYKRDKRKSDKFINGHDARDGRWDGRGPRVNRSLYRSDWDNSYRYSNRNRRRNYNRVDQYGNGRLYYYENYRRTNYYAPTKGFLSGILENILGG